MKFSKEQALAEFCLRLGDSNLIIGHRLSEWCGHGPILEEDIALINIALDHIGQSRILLSYAAELEGKGRSEDDLAFLRDVMDFKNALLTEQPNGDFAVTIARQFMFSTFLFHLMEELQKSADSHLSAYAGKAIKEVTYHVRHSGEWVARLGDGTEESHERMQDAVNSLWMFADDLFEHTSSDEILISEKIIPSFDSIRSKWETTVRDGFSRGTVSISENSFQMTGSRNGKHTEHLGFLLAEMQFLQRAYPGAQW